MISAAELLKIQADTAAATLTLSCTVQRAVNVSDGSGGTTTTYNTVATVLAGMSLPTANQLQNYDYMVGSLAAWQIKLPVGTDLQPQDHLIISGQMLKVHVVLTPRSLPSLLVAIAAEVK